MKQSQLWLLALLSVLALAVTTATASEGGAHLSGSWELGMSGINTKDNAARVNEYGSIRAEDGVSLAPQLDLEFTNGGFGLDLESETMGPRDQEHSLDIHAGRVFHLGSEYSVMEHHMDHDIMSHIGATVFGDIFGNQPRVTSPATIGNPENSKIYGPTVEYGVDQPVTDAIDAAHEQYQQELDNDYIITRREWKNEASLKLPMMPNVTIHAGARIEEREGLKQAITTSKCNNCHVSADAKEIDERTEEFTVGVVGKFGLLTLEYEYLTRDFEEDGATPFEDYTGSNTVHGNVVDDDDLFYGNGAEALEYASTPDSEKDSHLIKARLDLPNNSSISASYVKAEIDADKDATVATHSYELTDTDKLSSEYESFAVKGATRLGDLRLSVRGSQYEIDTDTFTTYFPELENNNVLAKDTADIGAGNYLYDTYTDKNHSFEPYQTHDMTAESREVQEFGFDAVYRLARYTTVRFGYEYEEIDRDEEEELGSTETNTYKLAANTRMGKDLKIRASVEYQDIDEPFKGAHVGIGQDADNWAPIAVLNTADFKNEGDNNSAVYYWNSVYPSRTLESTNQADEVIETKLSTTWNIATNMSMTAYIRARMEENDEVDYEQDTYVPGVTFWYAPNSKMNLTMAYNFNLQETENKMCVGWYHG
jgi:hypothetical protein